MPLGAVFDARGVTLSAVKRNINRSDQRPKQQSVLLRPSNPPNTGLDFVYSCSNFGSHARANERINRSERRRFLCASGPCSDDDCRLRSRCGLNKSPMSHHLDEQLFSILGHARLMASSGHQLPRERRKHPTPGSLGTIAIIYPQKEAKGVTKSAPSTGARPTCLVFETYLTYSVQIP